MTTGYFIAVCLMVTCFYQHAFRSLEYNLRKGLADFSLQHRDVSICEFEADCYTIHYQNCNTNEVGVAVCKNK